VSSSSAATVSHNGPKERWGADLAYVNTPVGFTLEYVHGRDLVAGSSTIKNGVGSKAGFTQVDEEGYTFTLFYNFGDQFVPRPTAGSLRRLLPADLPAFVRFDR